MNIQQMAEEAGIRQAGVVVGGGFALPDGIERFAALVRAHVLEEAAVLCEKHAIHFEWAEAEGEEARDAKQAYASGGLDATAACAADIRAAAMIPPAKEPPSEITNNRGAPMGPWGHE